jgi:hypothetical protein
MLRMSDENEVRIQQGRAMNHSTLHKRQATETPRFLSLCRVVRDPSDPLRFAGDADPRRYAGWQEAEPMLLVIEALHQFAVKAARIVYGKPVLMVPAQLRELALAELTGRPRLALAGTAVEHGRGYRVDVTAYDAAARTQVASGAVLVSVLSQSAPERSAQGPHT